MMGLLFVGGLLILTAHCLLELLATLTQPLVTIFFDTMKFTTSVIAIALAVAAPSVSGTSAAGMVCQRILDIQSNLANVCRVGVGSAVWSSFRTVITKHYIGFW